MKTVRDMLAGIVSELDLLSEVDRHAPRGVGENLIECIKRIAYDRRALIRLLEELEIKPDELGRYSGTDRHWNGWAGKPVHALREHLGLKEDPGDSYNHESWTQKEKRVARENHEKTAEYAQQMAEAWMNEYERRRKQGL